MKINRLILADSYKHSHWKQYPENTQKVFSYLESRGSEREYTETVFFGLQYVLKEYFADPITLSEIEEAKEITGAHGEPFNLEGWMHILEEHEGRIPLKIRAVPEGSVVPTHNALMTVENTCHKCFWVTSFFESLLLQSCWYGTTVATQSYYLKKLIYEYLSETADDPDSEIAFKLHDFGFRGVSSVESSGLGGLAHLVSFQGTDTMTALLFGRNYYNADMPAFSIPAGEHSTFSSWGRDKEVEAYRNMLRQFAKPGSLVAVVSDTWNIYNACEKIWGEELRQEVIDSGATVIIRPDSGDPADVLCGVRSGEIIDRDYDNEYESAEEYFEDELAGHAFSRKDESITELHKFQDKIYEVIFSAGDFVEVECYEANMSYKEIPQTAETKGILNILAEKFGYTVNSKGYKVLNYVRVIQGDGVNPDSIKEILSRMKEMGFSASNIAFGMGGALLQKVNRDTLKFAYKCSYAVVDGEGRDVYKDPVTDNGKKSKRGRLDLIKENGEFKTVKLDFSQDTHPKSLMRTVFLNGRIRYDDTFEEIRKRAKITLDKSANV